MSWFKKIFQNSTSKVEAKIEVQKEIIKDPTSEVVSTTSSTMHYSGLDKDFIGLLYFKDEIEQNEFISKLDILVSELEINEHTDILTGRKKVADYNRDAGDPIPFLNEILFYGPKSNKLENYYTALNLCSHNLESKTKNSFYDFKFEEDLINKVLEKSELYNFARVSTLFILGESFYKANQIESMENTFNKIRKGNYELSPSTVADYYRKIGEIYFELKQNEKSLDWLKAGLILNPKLGVKKLIDKLEKK